MTETDPWVASIVFMSHLSWICPRNRLQAIKKSRKHIVGVALKTAVKTSKSGCLVCCVLNQIRKFVDIWVSTRAYITYTLQLTGHTVCIDFVSSAFIQFLRVSTSGTAWGRDSRSWQWVRRSTRSPGPYQDIIMWCCHVILAIFCVNPFFLSCHNNRLHQ